LPTITLVNHSWEKIENNNNNNNNNKFKKY